MGSGQSRLAVQGDLSCPHLGRGPRMLFFLSDKEAGSPEEGSWGSAGGPGGLCAPCPRAQSAWISVTTATTFLGAPEASATVNPS